MFKRFTCMILAFVLLLALVPAGAISVSAAGTATSDKAITILKAIESFSNTCNAQGEIGYGTPCTGTGVHNGKHTIREEDADKALRKALQELDTAVNSFASSNGASLSQSQHDAMVLFTFRNGKAWMNGTDELRTAVIHGTTGNAFINAMMNWKNNNAVMEESYRKILANMYVNGKYSSTVPTNFVKITYDAKGGALQSAKTSYYYDRNLSESVLQIPTQSGKRFAGWLRDEDKRETLTTAIPETDCTVYASWQANSVDKNSGTTLGADLDSSKFYSNVVYKAVGGTALADKVGGTVHANSWYVDENGMEWVHIDWAQKLNGKNHSSALAKPGWVMRRAAKPGASASTGSGGGEWTLITVTNAYINVREKANIFSKQIGTVYANEQYWVDYTEENTGYLWGHIYTDKGEELGYIALRYTNYNDVINGFYNQQETTKVETVVARAVITATAYVNVRDGAGTQHNIISALRQDEEVELYETKYVNGQQWGRYKAGWFSLAYAKVTRLTAENTGSDIGFMSYVFTGKLTSTGLSNLYTDTKGTTPFDTSKLKAEEQPATDKTISISNITMADDGSTWGKVSYGKIAWGWVKLTKTDKVSSMNYVDLEPAKFYSVAQVSVRATPAYNATRNDSLSVGTEVTVSKIAADEETIWGYTHGSKYDGWVNLAQKYFSRNKDELKLEEATNGDETITTLATVINCTEVNVRNKASIFGTAIGKLAVGTTVEVVQGPINGTRKSGWYQLNLKSNDGREEWVRGDYLDVFEGKRSLINYGQDAATVTSPDGTKSATGRGMVANTYGGVNVRTAPGTANAKVTKLLPGTEVTILEVTYLGNVKWGRIEQGWVCMDYISMLDYDELPGSSVTVTERAVYAGHIEINANDSTTPSLATLKDAGVIDSDGKVVVYASTNSIDKNNIVRVLDANDPVTVHELLTAEEFKDASVADDENLGNVTTTVTSYWARINDGYIKLPQYTVALDAVDEAVYTVTGSDLLKVREHAGTAAARLEFDLKKFEQVRVVELAIIQASVWGRIEHDNIPAGKQGWISLAYCDKGAVSAPVENNGTEGGTATVPTTYSTGNTGVCNYAGTIIGKYPEVNVRKEPSTHAEKVTDLKKGAAVTITETKLADDRSWGYCGTGWIDLLYLDLAPVGITAVDAKVIGNEGAVVYESSNTGAQAVGSYVRRAVVNIYEEVNGMYKTDMGWIAKANVLN